MRQNESVVSFNYASGANATPEEVDALVRERFTYKPWDQGQTARGWAVTESSIGLAKIIILNVPPSPTRTRALNLIEEARMLANAAITHEGKF